MDQKTPTDGASSRLDSWKEIALFFSKDVRTVKRWEKERNLPVHRAPGKPGGSVYAFTGELTNWLNSTSSKGDEEDAVGEVEDKPSPRYGIAGIASAFVIVAIVLAIAWFSYSRHTSSNSSNRNPAIHGSSNPEAVDLYLKGRFEWSKRSPESLNKAVDYFTQAIVRDSNYAQAYAGLADTYDLLREYTAMPSNEAYPRAIAAAKKAVELDDSLPEAHRALAFATFYWVWDFATGEREFKRAIELDPKDAVSHHWYGTALGAIGRFSDALPELEKARELDPSSISIQADRALYLCVADREEEGLSLLKQIEATDPNFISPHRYLADLALIRHDYRVFLAESRTSAELAHDQIGLEVANAAQKGFAKGGGESMLESLRQIQENYYDQGIISGYSVAETCALLGKTQEAIHYLQAAFTKHDPAMIGIRSNLFLQSLHKDAAFQNLVKQVGLPPVT